MLTALAGAAAADVADPVAGLLESYASEAVIALAVMVAGGFALWKLYGGRPEEEPDRLASEWGPTRTRREIDREARRSFARAASALFASVAAADGEVKREEIRAVRHFFESKLGYDVEDLVALRQELEAAFARLEGAADTGAVLREACARAREGMSAPARSLLLRALSDMAGADGRLTPAERAALGEVARGLGVDEAAHRAVARSVLGEAASDYVLLGLDPACADDEVKRAFRARAAEVHPDKVAHLGPAAFQQASKTFLELKDAYDRVRAQRGL